MRFLPFVIYNRCPEEKLKLLLKLIRLIDLCVAFEMCDADIQKLESLIEDFGNTFKTLYPKKKTLKLHCLVHLATQCRIHGPLRQQWNFRFEAMHSKFTSIFPALRSMKNPALTAALRHLSSRNAEISECMGENYLTENDRLIGIKSISIAHLPEGSCLSEKFPDLCEEDTISKVEKFLHRGSQWYEGVILLLNQGENLFGRIQSVYMIKDDIFFTYNILKTEYVSHHTMHMKSSDVSKNLM
jgi:hypothetical protein